MKNVIYTRISNDEQVSSIENQIDLCKMFAMENNITIDDIYIDIGYSGSNYNRPDFKRLIEDINKKTISTILVKDLSRFGRNFVETSYYIEVFLKNNNILLIAINDNIYSNFDNEIILPIKNFMNEQYIKECRKKRFKYIEATKNKIVYSNLGVYGYCIRNKEIVIDSIVSPAIHLIFDMYLNGSTIKEIIQRLIICKYVVPGYRKSNYKVSEEKKYDWKPYMIYRILKTKEYTGVAENLKTIKIKSHRFKNEFPVELIDRYPVIIPKDKYDKVQKKLINKIKKDNILIKDDFNFCFLNEFKAIITFYKDELINEYMRRKTSEIGYFKKMRELENKIKICIENNYDSNMINSYNNQIKDLNDYLKKETKEFESFWDVSKIYDQLEIYLLDKHECIKFKDKNLIKLYYCFRQ